MINDGLESMSFHLKLYFFFLFKFILSCVQTNHNITYYIYIKECNFFLTKSEIHVNLISLLTNPLNEERHLLYFFFFSFLSLILSSIRSEIQKRSKWLREKELWMIQIKGGKVLFRWIQIRNKEISLQLFNKKENKIKINFIKVFSDLNFKFSLSS